MLYIVTGEMNCGKTTKVRELHKLHGGDGFVSDKIFINGQHTGYNLTALKSPNNQTLAIKKEFYLDEWKNSYNHGSFVFNLDIFSNAVSRIESLISDEVKPIFLDEIGYLETRKQKGFHSIIEKLAKYQYDVYLVIRLSCLNDAIKIFDFKNYRILNLSD